MTQESRWLTDQYWQNPYNYADEVRQTIAKIEGDGRKLSAFLAESLIGCGGQVIAAPGFLSAAADATRAASGVVIQHDVRKERATFFW